VQDELPSADKIHHEDLVVGRPITFGRKVVTKDEIIAFARQYDPQPMHLDEEAARATPVGGLCASGFHTCAMMMRMICDGPLSRTASEGAPGVEEVRWLVPVRPGDVLSLRHMFTSKRTLGSRPDVGLATVDIELLDANERVLCTWKTTQLTRLRHPEPAAPAGQRTPRQPLASLWEAAVPAAPWSHGFFEDRVIGETGDFGRHTFTKDEIIAFARQFDPQPFHIDEVAAKNTLFGGLCASGWHTAAIFIRHVVMARRAEIERLGAAGQRVPAYGPSPGFRNLRWLKPVYAGDTIEFRGRLSEKIDLKSRPDRGLLASEVQGRNQKGEIVFAITSQILAERRIPYSGA
jgi:acyl dehydratase